MLVSKQSTSYWKLMLPHHHFSWQREHYRPENGTSLMSCIIKVCFIYTITGIWLLLLQTEFNRNTVAFPFKKGLDVSSQIVPVMREELCSSKRNRTVFTLIWHSALPPRKSLITNTPLLFSFAKHVIMGQHQPVCDPRRELKHSSCNPVVWVPVNSNHNKRIATAIERHLQTEKG